MRLQSLRARHGHRDGADLLAAMVEEFPERLAVISSFGIESAVLLSLVASVDPGLPVIFLDTGALFDETLAYRDQLVEQLGLRDVRTILPLAEDLAEADELWRSDAGRCCALRKVLPMQRAVTGFDALVDGRKRFHGGDRSLLQTIEAGESGRVKISPLARWSEDQIAAAFAASALAAHPLAAQGYRSVGCWPCSRPSLDGEGPRAGRWAGSGRTECGIHLPLPQEAAQ